MKKKKDINKEELLKIINEMSESDDISNEDKEKFKELAIEIDKAKIYTKFTFLIAYIFIYLFKLIVTYLFSLLLIGLFSNFLLLENKLYVFLIPLGMSLLFTTLDIAIYQILNKRRNIDVSLFKLLFVILTFMIINKFYPIFKTNAIWFFYIPLVYIFDTYFSYGYLRRKLWNVR